MADNEFSIRITIDGSTARSDAAQIRRVVETELSKLSAVKIDTKALEQIIKNMRGQVAITGSVQVTGLEQAAAGIRDLQALSRAPFVITGQVDITGLDRAAAQVAQIREAAGGLGRAVAAGLSRQAGALEKHLTDLQSRVTGLVRAGEKMDISAPLEWAKGLEDALTADDKKMYDLVLRMKELNAQADVLRQRFAELGTVRVEPLGGGPVQTLEDLFRGWDRPHVRSQIRRAIRGIEADKEILKLGDDLQAAMQEVERQAAAAGQQLAVRLIDLQAEMQAMLRRQPPGMALLRPEQMTEAQRAWQQQYTALEAEYTRVSVELQNVRERNMSEDVIRLRDAIENRRRALEQPLEEEHMFWREWAMQSVDDVVRELRYHGQTLAAESLAEMYAVWERRKAVEEQLKRGRGRLARGAEVELPAGAAGTMVDFIRAERALEEAAAGATRQLSEQFKVLGRLVKRLDEAALAAQGLSAAQREAFRRMEALAMREIKAGAPLTGATTLEQARVVAEDVLTRLTAQQEAIRRVLEDPQIEQAAARPISRIQALWQALSVFLIGRSLIPDMVGEINRWLAQIGVESPFQGLVAQSEDAATRIIQHFRQMVAGLDPEQVALQISVLQREIRSLEQQFADLSIRSTQASDKYRREFEEAVEMARQMRGFRAEDEARYAMGYLPIGFGVGAGETRFHKAGRRRLEGEVGELTDQWYKALNVEMEEVRRFSQEERQRLDSLATAIVSKQAQLAALLRGQLEQAAQTYSQALTQATGQVEFEQVYRELGDVQDEIRRADQALATAIDQMQMAVRDELQLAASEAEKEARAVARLPATRAEAEERVQAARAAAAEAVEVARQATIQVREEERRLTAALVGEVKAREAQKTEAAKRATLKARAIRQGQIEEAKAEGRISIEDAKATAQARIHEERRYTQWHKDELRKRAAAERTAAQEFKREQTARAMAAEMGIDWDTYIQKARQAGVSLEVIIGTLRRVQREQREAARGAAGMGRAYRDSTSAVERYARALHMVRMQSYGVNIVLSELHGMASRMRFASAALTGSLVLAGRSYLELAQTSDRAARSLMLSTEMTQELRREIIGLSMELPMVDPQQFAESARIWAAATGQVADTSEDLRTILQQTIPIQELVAMTQTDIAVVTDGVAASLRQYGLEVNETNQVVAIFNKVADDTLAEVADIAEAFKYVGPQARAMGEEIEDTAAVLGILADQNIRGSQAGRAYRQMLLSLVEPTEKTREALEETFGVEQPFYDAGGAFVGLARVIDMLAAASEQATDEERNLLIATMFTANAVPAVTALVENQIEARKRGVDAIRAESKLLRGFIDEEVKLYANMRQEVDGTTVAMIGAVETWEANLEHWEESDVARVAAVEKRWKALWLTIGDVVVESALPMLEEASGWIEKVTEQVEAGSPLGRIIAALIPAGIAGTAIATLAATATNLIRTVWMIRSFIQAGQLMQSGLMTSATHFQTQVVSAGERFAAIIEASAHGAAATEQAGAQQEVAIEVAGAQQEVAIEVAGAQQEAAIEKSSAIGFGSIVGRAFLATGVAELLARAMTGQGIAGWFTTQEGEMAAELRFAELAGATRGELQRQLAQVVHDLDVVRQFYERGMLDPSLIFGKAPEYTRFEEIMGGRWRALSATAVQDKIAELEALRTKLMGAVMGLDDYEDAILREARAAGEATSATQELIDTLYHLPPRETKRLTDEQKKAAELYIEYLEKQADALDDFNDRMADLLADLTADLARMEKDYRADVQALIDEYNEQAMEEERRFQDRQAKARRDHALRMARMEEDHLIRMLELAQDRDALGMVREQRQYQIQRRRAEEDFAIQESDAGQQFREEQNRRRQEHQQRLIEMQKEYEEQKAERLAEYEERKAELEAQHVEDMERLRKEYFEKINAELEYFKLSKKQQWDWLYAMYVDAAHWLRANYDLWDAYVKSLPVPRPYGTPGKPARQFGGYTRQDELVQLHRGEFTLTAQTTRYLERTLGPLTQQRLIEGLAHRSIQQMQVSMHLVQQYEFHGGFSQAEREWFRQVARQEAEGAFDETLKGLQSRGVARRM